MAVFMKSGELMKKGPFQAVVQKKFGLSATLENIVAYRANQTGGKFLLCPNMEDAGLVGEELAAFGLQ